MAQFYYEHVSQRCGEAKSISIWKSTPTPWTDADVAFLPGVQCIIYIKDTEDTMLVGENASTEMKRNKSDCTSKLT
jgi:hypothetical protein